jgi:hypothetical protein
MCHILKVRFKHAHQQANPSSNIFHSTPSLLALALFHAMAMLIMNCKLIILG